MKKYICTVCDWVYDPEAGDPESGIAPGTSFEDIPEDWVCPVCGVGKEDFQPVERRIISLIGIKNIISVSANIRYGDFFVRSIYFLNFTSAKSNKV